MSIINMKTTQVIARMINSSSVIPIEIPKNLMRIKTPAAMARTARITIRISAKSPLKNEVTALRISPSAKNFRPVRPRIPVAKR